jgi:hypothetical protein
MNGRAVKDKAQPLGFLLIYIYLFKYTRHSFIVLIFGYLKVYWALPSECNSIT